MLHRLVFAQCVLRIVCYKSRSVKRLFQTKSYINVQFGKCPQKQYRVAPLKRLVECRNHYDHDANAKAANAYIYSRTLSDFVSFLIRYLQLLPQMVKAVMSGSCEMRDLCPPAAVRGMTKLDKDAFGNTVSIPAVRIPLKSIKHVSKVMKSYFLKIPKVKPIVELSNTDPEKTFTRLVLLNPAKCSHADDLPEEAKAVLKTIGVKMEHFEYFVLDLKYENWSIHDVLRAVLPQNTENVSGFSIIGHIAHLNLKPEVEDYKYLIGMSSLVFKKLHIKKSITVLLHILKFLEHFCLKSRKMAIFAIHPRNFKTIIF